MRQRATRLFAISGGARVRPLWDLLTPAAKSALAGLHSVRKVNPDYAGSLITIRRLSDNAEQSIGALPSGAIDVQAISTFVGASSWTVTKVFDQIGSKDFTQSTPSLQPVGQIFGGTVRMLWGASATHLTGFTSPILVTGLPATMIVAGGMTAATAKGLFFSMGDDNGGGVAVGGANGSQLGTNFFGIKGSVAWLPTNRTLTQNQVASMCMVNATNGTNSTCFLDGTQATVTAGASQNTILPTGVSHLGRTTFTGLTLASGFIQESLVFSSALSAVDINAIGLNHIASFS